MRIIQVPRGALKRFLLMLSDRTFHSRVNRAIPSQAAVPARRTGKLEQEDRSGQLWIGFKEGGLVRGRPSGFAELAYLTTEPIQALHFDGAGRLWISSVENGVTRVADPTSGRPRIRSFGIAEGLSSNHIWCMTEDRFGRIYLGTGSGVDRLDPATGSDQTPHKVGRACYRRR